MSVNHRQNGLKAWTTRLHLWLGLAIGAQVLLWMASGVAMTWLPMDAVQGADRRSAHGPAPLDPQAPLIPINDVLIGLAPASVMKVELIAFLERPVYRVTVRGQGRRLIDAVHGTTLSPLSRQAALVVAETAYQGAAVVGTLDFLEEAAPGEYRGRLPVWKARFNDERGTTLYISPDDGRIVAQRNGWWRVYDLFWMLHIMDYGARTDINNLLLRIAATVGLLFAATGLGLVALRLNDGRYGRDAALFRRGPSKSPARKVQRPSEDQTINGVPG